MQNFIRVAFRIAVFCEAIAWIAGIGYLNILHTNIDVNTFVILTTLFLSMLLYTIYKLRMTPLVASLSLQAKPIPADGLRGVIDLLRRRANKLNLMALATLVLLLTSLVGGLFVFIYAEQITNIHDLQRAQLLTFLYKQSEDASRFYKTTTNGLSETNSMLEELRTKVDSLSRDPKYSFDMQRIDELITNSRNLYIQNENVRELVATIRDLASSTSNTISQFNNDDKSNQSKNSSPYAVFFARLGSLVILFLAVQVFGRLYRFNIRLAAEYDAKADALEAALAAETPGLRTKLGYFKSLFNPPDINLQDVKSPLEYIFGGIQSAASRRHQSGGEEPRPEQETDNPDASNRTRSPRNPGPDQAPGIDPSERSRPPSKRASKKNSGTDPVVEVPPVMK